MAIQEIRVNNTVYRFEGITEAEAERVQKKVLTDPVTQTSELNPPRRDGETEVGYKPGVTDPVEGSLIRAANLVGVNPIAVSSSEITDRDPSQIERVIEKKPETLVFQSAARKTEEILISDFREKELEDLSQARSLFLNLEELRVIQNHYKELGREPTDLELEVFAQTWSEHCYHKTFKAVLVDEEGEKHEPLIEKIKSVSERYFEKAGVVSAFGDNAGGISFYDGLVIIGKGETHNSPVAIDPYAGSLTKNGGVFRDIAGFGKGGQNAVSFMINNFASPHTPHEGLPEGVLPPKYLMLENSRGELEYGNPMGIPTHGITLHFHPDFAPKPTSLGIVIGTIPEEHALKEVPQKGDLIVSLGGKTGRDGIHGATFSSGEMTPETLNTHSTAVQLGDPIVEKAMFDAIVAARDRGLIRSITDCGAGGYSSAIGEMAEGVGAEINLEFVATKYEGLSPWEIFLSESQERMVLATVPGGVDELRQIADRYDTKLDVIGRFTGDNTLTVKYEEESCGSIDLGFLHSGLPQRVMKMKRDSDYPEAETRGIDDYGEALKAKLADLTICSKEEMHRMYDQTVQAKSVMAPYVGVNQDISTEASIFAPIPDKPYGVVASHAANPILNRLDPHHGSKWAFAHAAAKFTAAGGNIDEAAGIDNFIWPFPDEESLYDLYRATEGLVEIIEILEIPMVSGKDSLSSTYRGKNGEVIKVPPTLNITIFGKIPDIEKTVTPDLKSTDSVICMVGDIDFDNLGERLKRIRDAIFTGKVKSAKAVGEGGVAVALAQMCIGGDCGVEVNLADSALFSETAGAILVEVESEEVASELFSVVSHAVLGKTKLEKRLTVIGKLNEDVDELRKVWQAPMKEILK
jgi:phosphoribosylformylglycinamidine synthase